MQLLRAAACKSSKRANTGDSLYNLNGQCIPTCLDIGSKTTKDGTDQFLCDVCLKEFYAQNNDFIETKCVCVCEYVLNPTFAYLLDMSLVRLLYIFWTCV